jgi:hypothetical protein
VQETGGDGIGVKIVQAREQPRDEIHQKHVFYTLEAYRELNFVIQSPNVERNIRGLHRRSCELEPILLESE